jgi:hypothetical protein
MQKLNSVVLCCISFISMYVQLYSQDMEIKPTISKLELVGNVEALTVREIVAKGTKFNLIRRNTTSEAKYIKGKDACMFLQSYKQSYTFSKYDYNQDNNIQSIINYNLKDSAITSKTLYFYKNNDPNYELVYEKDSLVDSIAIQYDPVNNHTIRKHYYNGRQLRTEDISRNAHDEIIQHIQMRGDSYTKLTYRYDKSGTRLLEEAWYLGTKKVQSVKYKYDDKHWLINKTEYDADNEETVIYEYEHDILSGNVTSIKNGEHLTEYEYNYDNIGNWTTKYEFYDGYPVKITERDIVYKK